MSPPTRGDAGRRVIAPNQPESARLVLGGEEEDAVDCGADIVPGFDWLHARAQPRLHLRLGRGLFLRRTRLHVGPPRPPGPCTRRGGFFAGHAPLAG